MSGGDEGRIVFSTRAEALCPACGRLREDCACATPARAQPAGDVVRVGRETKGRRGKGVTVIQGLPLGPAALVALAKELKARCGCGGTVKDGVIEIQGDHRDALVTELTRRGYAARRSGG